MRRLAEVRKRRELHGRSPPNVARSIFGNETVSTLIWHQARYDVNPAACDFQLDQTETGYGIHADTARCGHELHVQPAAARWDLTRAPEGAWRHCTADQGLRFLSHGLA